MISEKWLPIKGYEGAYEINILGVVRSLRKKDYHRVLVSKKDRAGYYTVRLSVQGDRATKFVHRLLAEVFLPNDDNKTEVNHINGIKTDNAITNLEWVTHSENMKHAYNSGLIATSPKKCRKIIDDCTGETFFSIREAANRYGINYTTCRNMLCGVNRNTTCLKYAA